MEDKIHHLMLLRKLRDLKVVRSQMGQVLDPDPEEAATQEAILSLEEKSRTRVASGASNTSRFQASFKALDDGSNRFAAHFPRAIMQVRRLQVVGGTLLHPMCPVFREGRDDVVPLGYQQHWPVLRLRVASVVGSRVTETTGGVVTVQVDVRLSVSPQASDGDAADSVVRKAVTEAARATEVVRSVDEFSADIGDLQSIVVNTAPTGRHDGASYAMRGASFRADVLRHREVHQADGIMFKITAYSDVLRRIADMTAVLEEGRARDLEVEASAQAVLRAQASRAFAGEVHDLRMHEWQQQETTEDELAVRVSHRLEADRSLANAVSTAMATHAEALRASSGFVDEHGGAEARERRLSDAIAAERARMGSPRAWQESEANPHFMHATAALGLQLSATYASSHAAAGAVDAFLAALQTSGVTAAAVPHAPRASVSRLAYVDLVLEPASLSLERSMYVLMGVLNHYARILEEGTTDSTLKYVDVGSYGARCSVALRPPPAAAASAIHFMFANTESQHRHAAPVFGFESTQNVTIRRGAAMLSPHQCQYHRIGQSIGVRCPEVDSRTGGGQTNYWFDYGCDTASRHEALICTGTVSLSESTGTHAVAEFSPPMASLSRMSLTLHAEDGSVIPSADMPRGMHLTLEVDTPSS